MSEYISTIILAAGSSKRLGKLKQLLPISNSTLIEHTIDKHIQSLTNEIILVIDKSHNDVRTKISNKPIKIIENNESYKGMSTSIICGLKAINPSTKGIMIALCDQPFLTVDLLNQLIKEFWKNCNKIIVPVYKSIRGNPVIFPIRFKKELELLTGDKGGRDIIKKHPDEIVEIISGTDEILFDIDTKEEYKLASERIENEKHKKSY